MFNPFGSTDDQDLQLDLTPLIDVVFMLIIFFFVAGSFSKPVLELMLPNARTSEVSADSRDKELLIEIDQAGTIFFNGEIVEQDAVPALVAREPEVRMNLHVDARAPFASFLLIVDEAKAINRTNMVITTQKE